MIHIRNILVLSCLIPWNIKGISKNEDWSDYFNTIDFTKNISNTIINDTITVSESERYYIHDVNFIGMKNRSIYFKGASNDFSILFVERALFSKTDYSSSDNGGNMYVNINGVCVQKDVCALDCLANVPNKHCYIVLTKNESSKNLIHQCAFSMMCSLSQTTLGFFSGQHQLNQTNITKSESSEYSCFSISNIFNISTFELCNFRNNTATEGRALSFSYSIENGYTLKHSNIIELNCGLSYGVIFVNGELNIDSCFIADNIHLKNNMFYVFGQGITIRNSYIYNPNASSYYGLKPNTIEPVTNRNDLIFEFKATPFCRELLDYHTNTNTKKYGPNGLAALHSATLS